MPGHDHPLFSRLYTLLAGWEEGGSVGAARTEVATKLSGRTLIVGLGPGFDLAHLPAAVTDVVAVEPSAPMRNAARGRVDEFGHTRPIEVIDAVAETLPLPDDSVDSILFAYVLCSVDQPGTALREARRVLRADGVVGVLEHVRGYDGSWASRSQRLLAPVWPRLAGGCHCDRDTRAELEAAGFDTSDIVDESLVNLPPVAPAIIGTARPRPLT
jgi:ubiquinone/menaquinone biosynthesis C-methylase UbiE